jgi:hypothetical protein
LSLSLTCLTVGPNSKFQASPIARSEKRRDRVFDNWPTSKSFLRPAICCGWEQGALPAQEVTGFYRHDLNARRSHRSQDMRRRAGGPYGWTHNQFVAGTRERRSRRRRRGWSDTDYQPSDGLSVHVLRYALFPWKVFWFSDPEL